MKVLVTGGAGFIGSHTAVELLNAGHEVVIVDNFSNSHPVVLDRIQEITGKSLTFYELDILDKEALNKVFEENDIDAAINFASYKAVGESVQKPLDYYHNNLTGLLVLLEVMSDHKVKNIVFSSSATVYGMDNQPPFTEGLPTSATNPYGYTKVMSEQMLEDLYVADPEWSISILRYFNPIGAHESGLIGENPTGIPNNLVPYITQVAVGKLDQLSVFGDDYDTPDGTGVRDYIHVVDLARGHIKALEKISEAPGVYIHNLGTGEGYSVLDLVKTFEEVNGVEIPYKIVERRPGDIAAGYADPSKAEAELGWKAELGLDDMLRDSWNWQKNNPNGYVG